MLLAVEFMHANGVIHKDIRPENFVFCANGYLKLIDLGIARVWQPHNSSDTSGSPGYMAPEVLLRQNHSYVSDFFSLGVILHQLMLGSKPYSAEDRIGYKSQVE
jgi:serine/threonine protein kinase